MADREMQIGGIIEVREQEIDPNLILNLLLGRDGPDQYVGYVADGEVTEPTRLGDVVDAPTFLLRRREYVPAFMQAAREQGAL